MKNFFASILLFSFLGFVSCSSDDDSSSDDSVEEQIEEGGQSDGEQPEGGDSSATDCFICTSSGINTEICDIGNGMVRITSSVAGQSVTQEASLQGLSFEQFVGGFASECTRQ